MLMLLFTCPHGPTAFNDVDVGSVVFFTAIGVKSYKDWGEADSSSVDSYGLREHINFNKLSL